MEGSIVRVKLENFVTYSSLEFRPGKHLNVIIGPNGTGKSSLVSAICLGLAGKPSVLGRAQHASEFIKHEEEHATIEIELRGREDEEQNHIIQRQIKRLGTDLWTLDGLKVNLKRIEEFTRSLKIQVSNLCQFLPQDKVADFAKMSQQELLENTERAVDEGLYVAHQHLQTARIRERDLHQECHRSQELLEIEKEKNVALEPEVDSFKMRQSHLEKVDLLTKKKFWVEYEMSREQHHRKRKEKAEVEGSLKVARKQHAPLIAKRDDAQEMEKEISTKVQLKQQRIKEAQTEATSLAKQRTKFKDLLDDAKAEFASHQDEEQKRCQKISDVEGQINDLEEELASVAEVDLQPDIDAVTNEIRDVTHAIAAVSSESKRTQLLHFEDQYRSSNANLQKLMDIHNQRLEVLNRASADAHSAYMWLQSNQHHFQNEILGPVMLTLNIKDAAYAKYVESHIPRRDLLAFVCQSADDQDQLLKLLRQEKDLRINSVLAPNIEVKPSANIDHLRRFGFHSNLSDLFECPTPVMGFLQQMYRVQEIPVGDRSSYNKVEETLAHCKLRKFYTENHQFSVNVSRYGNKKVSTSSSELMVPRLLNLTSDHKRENFLKKQIHSLMKEISSVKEDLKNSMQQQKQMELKLESLRENKKELANRRNNQRHLSQKIQMKQDQVDRWKNSPVDIEHLKQQMKEKTAMLHKKMIACLGNLKHSVTLHVTLSIERSQLKLDHASVQAQRNHFEAQIRERASALQALENQFLEICEEVVQLKHKAKTLLAAAKKAVGIAPNAELTATTLHATMLNQFQALPNSLEELTNAIFQEQARADCAASQDANVVEEFNQRKGRIERLKKETEAKEQALQKHQESIVATREQWMNPLKDLIQRINENFSHFFQSMKCAGEVDLKVPEQEEDYEKYGIRIKVQYRDHESLRELTAHHQSGGERSVATVLFVMALQSLTQVPFRCVDEINQGMDPHNERRVFEIIMNTVCKERNSQYFLLTPKLLPDLEYDDNTTIHCIFNGTIANHRKMNIEKFLQRRAKFKN